MHNISQQRRGFTLIEILVVVGIIPAHWNFIARLE